MTVLKKRARYAQQALWLTEPLELAENTEVEIQIQLPESVSIGGSEWMDRLEQWVGSIKGASVPLEATRREAIYAD